MNYKIDIVGYKTIEIESELSILNIVQQFYDVPIMLKETDNISYHISIENLDKDTVSYYYVLVNELKDFVEYLFLDDINIKESKDNKYLYANHLAVLHTNTNIDVEENNSEFVRVPLKYVSKLYNLPKLTAIDIDCDSFFNKYYTLVNNYNEIYIKFKEETPIFNATYLIKILELFSAHKLYFQENFDLYSPCYVFLNDNINSEFYFMLLPVKYNCEEIGFICKSVKVDIEPLE